MEVHPCGLELTIVTSTHVATMFNWKMVVGTPEISGIKGFT